MIKKECMKNSKIENAVLLISDLK